MSSLHTALIRTHHITSRKKVAKLRAAASNYNVYALLRYGGCPGIMYCQGSESGVKDWVATVQRLRYKDFQLARKPAVKVAESVSPSTLASASSAPPPPSKTVDYGKLEEVDSVKEFGSRMEGLGVWHWWRKGMGYIQDDDSKS